MISKNKIAIVGMACRFPGADNIDEFWKVLTEGRDTITHFTDEVLSKSEYDYDSLKKNPDYVGAKGILNEIDKFDAGFFSYTPKEAETLDPQYRVWLEEVWHALENAGCDPFSYGGKIGVFAGGSLNTYLHNNILRSQKAIEHYIRVRGESFQRMLGNEVSFLPTKTAYKLNFRGPAVNVQTACSTSLVAVAMSCTSLINGESDMCVAGGTSILIPQETGYMYQEGAISSPDAVCRSFDKEAKGTVFSNGVGVVILKRLEDAVRDGDIIYSVITGWALNNDGSNKVSYAAPSIDGQTDVIKMAQKTAGVSPEDIGFIEAHGTATLLGDPVELTALTNAFREGTDKKQFCGIGSVKSNIGHTDVAAGIAGLIKASLSVCRRMIPPTIHFTEPNPFFDFENSPFYVIDKTKRWSEDKKMIGGVSAFGIGGTNVHVIIEEPPVTERKKPAASEWSDIVLLSARSENSLEQKKLDLVNFMKSDPGVSLTDIAYSLATGRSHMKYRSFAVAASVNDITESKVRFVNGQTDKFISNVAFMFPGQGAQYLNMGAELYRTNSFFRNIADRCFDIALKETGTDYKAVMFNDNTDPAASARLSDTEITQPALFIVEYALARLFMELNIKPSYLIGHSIGEYAAACIAGVFDQDTAMKIVLKRGKLMQKMPRGSMMAVKTVSDSLKDIKGDAFEIAADNADDFCTISFKPQRSEEVKTLLDQKGITSIPLNTSHAFHSSDFDPILDEFEAYVNQFEIKTPAIPFISCLTGEFITDEQAVSGKYWAQQLRNTVLFRKGITTITATEDVAFLEVGPNTHLSSLVKENQSVTNKRAVIVTIGKPDTGSEKDKIVTALGNLHNIGINVDFRSLMAPKNPSRVWLPLYPFEKKRCWIDFQLSGVVDESTDMPVREEQVADDGVSGEGDALLTPFEKTQKKITAIWSSLFGMDDIKPDENFFDIGGHSLLALQILTRIKEDLHQNIALKSFLDNPTITGLSSLVNDTATPESPEPELVHQTDHSHLTLSDNQKRLWIISKLDKFNPSYNVPFTYHLHGALNLKVFTDSLEILFQRHHIVFSLFKQKDGEPYCVIEPQKVNIELIDYTGEEPEARAERISTFIRDDSRKCFDIENGPLYRLFLLKDSDTSYFFHVNIHHLIFDGWSWGVFVRDLNKIYNGLSEGREPDLKDLPIQYYDYAAWQESFKGESGEEELTRFWVNYLKDCPPVINFPYDHARGKISTGKGGKVHIRVSEATTARLREICKRENSTLFSALLTAYGILLQKYSGDTDICLGTPVANRPMSKLEDVFGMFINTIAIRLKISPERPFNDLVGDVRNSTIEAISHQELPFEKVVEAINPVRTFNMNPLFQVCFAWQSNLSIPLDIKGVRGERFTIEEGISPFDMTFYMWENGDFIEGEIEYKSEILERETVIRLKDNFITLIDSLLDNTDKPVCSVPMISEAERKIIASINDNSTEYPRDKTIAGLFEEMALRYPDKPSISFNGSSLSYRSLNEKANQLARTLRDMGVKEKTAVGVLADKSLEMIVALLAIVKAGGCYTPIDPDFPDQRISFIIDDAGIKVILVQEKYLKIKTDQAVKVNLDSSRSYARDKSNLASVSGPEDPAYILYTSGTTGMPKGTPVPHRGVVRLVCNTNYIEFTSNDRVVLIGAIVFDASTMEIWGALLNGATLFIIDKDTILNPNALGTVVEKNKITIMVMTAALFTHVAENRSDILKNVKYLVVGGDVLSAFHANKVRKDNPGLTLINAYGPTENTTISTCYKVDRDFEQGIPIGKPISNSTAYVFDENMNYMPIGVIGDLYVGGDGLSSGYINRDELTRAVFREHPLNSGERIYKTGDRAKWLSDWNLEFHGRNDNQIKVRGIRIELEEIESVISAIDGVVETVIKPVEVKEGDYKLVAFLNVPESFRMTVPEITAGIKAKLPAFMVPSSFVFLNGFPRTINGKIDRKAACFNTHDLNEGANRDTGSYNPTEKALHQIWCDVLKTKNISIDDNFFEIGGNSLLAISVMSKTEELFDISLGLRVFFDSPKIKDLAEAIDVRKLRQSKEEGRRDSKSGQSKIFKGEI